MRFTTLVFAMAIALSGAALAAADKNPEMQSGSNLMGCLERTGIEGGFRISVGTVEGVAVHGPEKLKNHAGHWVKLTGESYLVDGKEHFRARNVTHIASTCDTGLAEMQKLRAVATLKNTNAETVGTVLLRQAVHGVFIRAEFSKLPPGRHALHIHETGDCVAPGFQSAGGHFQPRASTHGYLAGESHHAGDLPNFEVPKSGKTIVELTNPHVTLVQGVRDSLFRGRGTAFVIHQEKDDYESQPSGDAGKRIACGVIEQP